MPKIVRKFTLAVCTIKFILDANDICAQKHYSVMDARGFQKSTKIFEQELTLAGKYGLHFDLSKTKLHVFAGDDFQGDLRPFIALSINIIKGANVQMLQVPLIGSDSLYDEWNRTKVDVLEQAFTAIETLPHKHISLHLMKQCLSFPKLAYYARTIPRRHLAPVLEAHSSQLRATLQRLVAQELTDSQWQQATLPTKFGGLGLTVDELRMSGGRCSPE